MGFIHPSSVIFPNVVIGKNVYIGANCTIGGPPEHKDINPFSQQEYKRVIIGDGVRIYNQVNIDSGWQENTVIEDGVIIMAQSHIGHDCVIKKGAIISSGSILGGHTEVGENANTGINSTTHQKTEIGEGTILGAGCFAKGKLEPFCKYYSGEKAKNQGQNIYQLRKKDPLQYPDTNI